MECTNLSNALGKYISHVTQHNIKLQMLPIIHKLSSVFYLRQCCLTTTQLLFYLAFLHRLDLSALVLHCKEIIGTSLWLPQWVAIYIPITTLWVSFSLYPCRYFSFFSLLYYHHSKLSDIILQCDFEHFNILVSNFCIFIWKISSQMICLFQLNYFRLYTFSSLLIMAIYYSLVR